MRVKPQPAGVTLVGFLRLKAGSSYWRACQVLGQRGELVAQVGAAMTYRWKRGDAEISATFGDGGLESKARAGME